MNILLVWPKVESSELNNFLPLGLGYLGANLKPDHNVKIWDGVLNGFSNDRLIEEIKHFKADLVGVSVWNFNLDAARETVNNIKNNFKDIPVVIGGPEPSGQKEKILDTINADFAFAGEGEKPFRQLLELYSSSDLTPENSKNISGLIFRDENNNAVCNPPQWDTLDELKYCDYELLNLNQYITNGYCYGMHSGAKRTAPILTTRGCPFSCEYCSARLVNGKKIRARKVESVIAEIKELHSKYGIEGFNIIDDNFTFNIDYAKKVCREILKLGLNNISFSSPNGVKVEYLDNELLSLMKQVGWEWIFIAPESGSKQTLKNMRKSINIDTLGVKLQIIKDTGLHIFGFFIIGHPGETIKDILMTVKYACQNNFDAVVFTCFRPLPGTPVFEKLLTKGEIEEIPENSDYYEVTYAPEGLTINKLKLLRLLALLIFYTSSFKRFKTVLSSHSLKKKFRILIKFIK